jgi:hypothetical protein
MDRDSFDYERQAREVGDMARACGLDANRAYFTYAAEALIQKSRALAEGATLRLGQSIVPVDKGGDQQRQHGRSKGAIK